MADGRKVIQKVVARNPRHVTLMNRLHFLAPHIRTKGRKTLSSSDDSMEPQEQQKSQVNVQPDLNFCCRKVN